MLRVAGFWLLGYWSLVAGLWSLVTGHWYLAPGLITIDIAIRSGIVFLTPGTSMRELVFNRASPRQTEFRPTDEQMGAIELVSTSVPTRSQRPAARNQKPVTSIEDHLEVIK